MASVTLRRQSLDNDIELPRKRRSMGKILIDLLSRRKTSEKIRNSHRDVVKCGYLYIKRSPYIPGRAWRKRFVVLYDDSNNSSLQIFRTRESWQQGVSPEESHDFPKITWVDEYRRSKSYPDAVSLYISDASPLIMAAETHEDIKEWTVAVKLLVFKSRSSTTPVLLRKDLNRSISRSRSLPPNAEELVRHSPTLPMPIRSRLTNSDNPHSSSRSPKRLSSGQERVIILDNHFPVTLIQTPSSKRAGISGKYMLSLNELGDTLLLRDLKGTNILVSWPISNILKITVEPAGVEEVVTLDCSVLSGENQGQYKFKTNHGADLLDKMRITYRKADSEQMAHSSRSSAPNSPGVQLNALRQRQKSKTNNNAEVFRGEYIEIHGDGTGARKTSISSGESQSDNEIRTSAQGDLITADVGYLQLLPDDEDVSSNNSLSEDPIIENASRSQNNSPRIQPIKIMHSKSASLTSPLITSLPPLPPPRPVRSRSTETIKISRNKPLPPVPHAIVAS